MANGIIPVSWGKELRPSAVNSLDKINEVIHFINQSDIHEFTFSDSGSGESVQTANSTQLLDLTVHGKCVQDGTPTPENPVPVEVVGGRNLLQITASTQTINGVTFTVNQDGSIIGLQIGETVTPIDLEGHVLAGLPDGTQDVLKVDSTGRVWIEKNVYLITFTNDSSETWTNDAGGKRHYTRLSDGARPVANNTVIPKILSNRFVAASADSTYIGTIGVSQSIDGMSLFFNNLGSGTMTVDEWKTWIASNNITVVYPLATPQTIELDAITPPAIPDGSIIKINASLTPAIDVEWFTEDTLPKMMNSILGLIRSLHPNDFPMMLSSSMIHSIDPTMQVPDIQPIDIQPIDIADLGTVEKIKMDVTEETENESEVQ